MILAELATLELRKREVFWSKGYDIIISVSDDTNKILSCDSNYIVAFVRWPKFGNSNISIIEGIEILHQCGKRVKTKSQNVLGVNFYVCKNYRKNTGRGPFCPFILNRIMQKLCKFITHFSKTLLHHFLHFVSNWAHFVEDVASYSSILHSNFSFLLRSVLGPDFLFLSNRYKRLPTKLYLFTILRWFY